VAEEVNQLLIDADQNDTDLHHGAPAMQYQDEKIFPYGCPRVFALVADIESYPQFLPGWSRVRVLHSDDHRLEVEQQLQLGPFPVRFHSSAELERCRSILITSSDAPFGRMTIEWCFTPRDQQRCQVSLTIDLALNPGSLRHPLQRLLKHGSGELLRLFEERAREVYG